VSDGIVSLLYASVEPEELESSLLFLAHEMMVRLKRNRERRMSICLTRFPISGLGELNI
jgi:hypothetical protein